MRFLIFSYAFCNMVAMYINYILVTLYVLLYTLLFTLLAVVNKEHKYFMCILDLSTFCTCRSFAAKAGYFVENCDDNCGYNKSKSCSN